jgi:hypothetical protein
VVDTKAEVKPLNRGDLSLNPDPNVTVAREDVKNISALKLNVMPGDVVNIKEPTKSYGHFWHREVPGDEFSEDELSELKEAGFEFVNTTDFKVARWSEATDGRIRSGRRFLMYIEEGPHAAREIEKLRALGIQIDQNVSSFHATAERAGVGSFEVRGGRKRDVVKAKDSVNLS